MAVNTRLTAPSYKIFEPDALDVALSNKVLDPLQGGIAGAMLLSHNADQAASQQQFLDRTDKFNEMARGLDAMEIAQKSQEARMKLAPGLLEHGTNAADILGISDILTPNGIRSNDAATLFGDKTRAEIASALAKAAHAGDGTKETTTENTVDAGTGTMIAHKYGGAPRVAAPVVDPTVSTAVPTSTKAPTVQVNQTVQRAIAAVGASDPSQIAGGKDASGNFIIKNTATGKTATFDPTGKQIR